MKFREYNKRIVGIAIILSMTFQFLILFAQPKEAQAIFGVGDIVADPGNIVQSTISAISNAASEVSEYSQDYKETILDPIAYAVAKTLLRSLTTSIVQWINSGFEGSPSFLTDPAGFFENIAGEQIGEFIAGNSDLSFLCSAFSIDVRIALALKYRPFKKKISCTLADVIKNVTNAVNNASINGFTAGDFKQGGWPAFASLTTEPQNNFYGAYLEGEAELDARLGNLVDKKKSELNQGAGFLSYQSCHEATSESVADESSGYENKNTGKFVNKRTKDGRDVTQYCETVTPGSVISGGLQKSIGAPVDELNLADEFNEIANALFAQLLKQVIVGGLKGVSGTGASDQNSFLNRINNSGEGKVIQNLIKRIKKDVDKFLEREADYLEGKISELGIVTGRADAYEAAAACFEDKANRPEADSADRIYLLGRASSTRDIITNDVDPLKEGVEQDISDAETNIELLTSVKEASETATSSDTLNSISEVYNDFVMGGTLHDAKDIGNLEADRERMKDKLDAISPTAASRMKECNDYAL